MKLHGSVLIFCGAVVLLAPGCATKKFVREEISASETRIGQRVDTHEAKLRETSDRAAANSQAIGAAGQQITALDTRIAEVSAVANDAKKQADSVSNALRETDAKLSQRFANRNKYSMVDTKTVYFDSNKATLRDEGINELQDVANALKADPNAVVELRGFADPRGTARYNYRLTRERVDAVVRHLVQHHGIALHRIYAVGMGEVARQPGERAGKQFLAQSRRVEIRLLAPPA